MTESLCRAFESAGVVHDNAVPGCRPRGRAAGTGPCSDDDGERDGKAERPVHPMDPNDDDLARRAHTPAERSSARPQARRRLSTQRTASVAPATAKPIPTASRSPFHAACSNARPPRYPSNEA